MSSIGSALSKITYHKKSFVSRISMNPFNYPAVKRVEHVDVLHGNSIPVCHGVIITYEISLRIRGVFFLFVFFLIFSFSWLLFYFLCINNPHVRILIAIWRIQMVKIPKYLCNNKTSYFMTFWQQMLATYAINWKTSSLKCLITRDLGVRSKRVLIQQSLLLFYWNINLYPQVIIIIISITVVYKHSLLFINSLRWKGSQKCFSIPILSPRMVLSHWTRMLFQNPESFLRMDCPRVEATGWL